MIKTNADDIKRKIEASLKSKGKAIEQANDDFLTGVARDAKINVAQNKSIASGELIAAIDKDKDSVVVRKDYAGYVEFGTKTKVKIPNDPQVKAIADSFRGGGGSFDDMIENLEEWARHKGIMDKGVVFKIAREIARKGSSAKPFFFPAVFKNKIKFKTMLKKALEKR